MKSTLDVGILSSLYIRVDPLLVESWLKTSDFQFSLPLRNHAPPPQSTSNNTTMSLDTPTTGSGTWEPVSDIDFKPRVPRTHDSRLILVRVVQRGLVVTNEYRFLATECTSMKHAFYSLKRHLKDRDLPAYNLVYRGIGKSDRPTKAYLQKTARKRKHNERIIQASWERPGTYSSWFHEAFRSGNSGAAVKKLEFHFSNSQLHEHYESKCGWTWEKLQARETEKEFRRPYKRVNYLAKPKSADMEAGN